MAIACVYLAISYDACDDLYHTMLSLYDITLHHLCLGFDRD